MTDETQTLGKDPETDTEADVNNMLEDTDLNADLEEDDEVTSPDDVEEGDEEETDDGENEDDTEGEEDVAEPEAVEIDYDGKKFKVPAELKDAFLRQGDYTRKTQEVAEQRKVIEAEREQVQQLAQTSQEEIGALADLRAIDNQLQQYQNFNWQAAYAQDFVETTQLRAAFDDLKERRNETVQKFSQAQQQRTEQAKQMTAQRLQATAQHAQKTIPNWSPDLDNQITQFAMDKGFTRETLEQAYTPEVYETLYLAYLGDQFLKKQAASKPKPKQQTEKKPLSKVSSKGATAGKKDLNDMDVNEFAAYRNKQERAKALRSR